MPLPITFILIIVTIRNLSARHDLDPRIQRPLPRRRHVHSEVVGAGGFVYAPIADREISWTVSCESCLGRPAVRYARQIVLSTLPRHRSGDVAPKRPRRRHVSACLKAGLRSHQRYKKHRSFEKVYKTHECLLSMRPPHLVYTTHTAWDRCAWRSSSSLLPACARSSCAASPTPRRLQTRRMC